MNAHREWLVQRTAERKGAGLWRAPLPREADDPGLDLAGNDYLGMSRDPRVVAAAAQAAGTWGAGATGSRLVTGTTALHVALETELADFTGAAAALVFSSGYLANLGVLQALADADTLLVCDAANHASLIDGARLSRGSVIVTPSGDSDAVGRALAARKLPRALIVTDSVSSADGKLAPVAELYRMAERHGALLVVDEAHALGVVGPGGVGAVAAAGLADRPDVVRTVTLSKALGSQGGALLGDRALLDYVANTARSYIFDTGLAPASAGAAQAALAVLRGHPELAAQVRDRAAALAAGLGAPAPSAAIVNVRVGDPQRALAAAEQCRRDGVAVGCFRPPSVPVGTSRLRVTARCDLDQEQIARATAVIRAAVMSHR